MQVHRSNRAEALVDALSAIVARPLGDPLAAECIVVQGRGMERWLSMELARRLGVWANPRFPFPRALLEEAFAAVLGPDGVLSPCFAPETLLWSVADLLPRHLARPEFAPIASYLADDERGVKRFQLAERIADTFDQYVVYRPAMILGWEAGAGADWQAVLWRALVARHGSMHIAARAAAFLAAVRTPPAPPQALPSRISLFGVSTLPPLYLELLEALSHVVELHLFVLSPSREYWADIRSQRDMLRARRMREESSAADVDLHIEEGHPMLASLGRLGRDFQSVLESTGDYEENETDLYRDPGTGSVLATLQSDILSLRDRRGEPLPRPLSDTSPPSLAGKGAGGLASNDDSIRIHACHGAMREVEVLHDQLLALFDADPSLQPHDVAVMSPAIDTYAPLIDAVFGGEHSGRPRISYRIADRHVRATEPVADAFARVLDLLHGRMTAPEVLDLLALDAVRERFGIAAEDVDLIRTWVTQAGIRWGADAAHRASVEQPALEANTWRFGLDRLFLGYAMPTAERAVYKDVLPYDDVEGGSADVLGRLAEFCAALCAFREQLQEPRRLEAWREDLGALLERMVERTNPNAYQHHRIRDALARIAERAQACGFDAAVDLATVRSQLDAELERGAATHGFLSGGVTFCALVPMRTIPFRVICLLGMNDDAFPRVRRPLGFDLMVQHPLPGDRCARDDDRYLFLEALLSARQRLLVTYVGQSINDNTEIPPSVVVSELLDVLEGQADDDLPPVVVRHPLQPFSPLYFGASPDPRLFSYARSYCDGARALVRPRPAPAPFLPRALPLDAGVARVVTLDDLVRFFEHPVRAFLQRRLELYLGDDSEVVEDREPLELNFLQQWQIGDALLRPAIEGADLRAAFAGVRASGRLPLGILGQCTFDELRPRVEAIASIAAPLVAGGRLAPVEVDRELDDGNATHITGLLRDVWPAGQVRWQYSKLGGRQELALWIRHLVLNWVGPAAYPRVSHLVGRPVEDGPGVVRFGRVDDPQALLRQLLDLYWLGQTVPLPLFPRASRAYAVALDVRGDDAWALQQARLQWVSNQQIAGECDDAYVQQAFGEHDPLDALLPATDAPSFRDLALSVFGPLLAHREDGA